jgi:hypothetical protein
MQTQLAAQQDTDERMRDSFSTLNTTLTKLDRTSHANTDMLAVLAEKAEQTDEHMHELYGRNQKHVVAMSVVSWSLAIVALTVAGFVAVSVGRMSVPGEGGAMQATTPGAVQSAEPVKVSPVSNPSADAGAGVEAAIGAVVRESAGEAGEAAAIDESDTVDQATSAAPDTAAESDEAAAVESSESVEKVSARE